jgi:hypothetical protein
LYGVFGFVLFNTKHCQTAPTKVFFYRGTLIITGFTLLYRAQLVYHVEVFGFVACAARLPR